MIYLLIGVMMGIFCATGTVAYGGSSHSIKFGPHGGGNGGSNPIDIPPNFGQVEYTYVSDGGVETNIGVIPGILVGGRMERGSWYLSLGGGLLLDANGVGFGVYNSFGYVTGSGPGWHWNFEYKQSVAPDLVSGGLIAPSAARFGIIWK
jgi:hypothetical protein